MRFYISQRIFSAFGGNLLRVMTRWVGYIFLCARNARAYSTLARILRLARGDMGYVLFMFTHRVHAWLSIHLSSDGLSCNLMGTYFKSPQVAWVTYLLYSRIACTHASERVVKRSLIFDGFSSNLLDTYYKSPQAAWATYFPCSYTARMRASARMGKRSHIFGRILSKFGKHNMLTTSYIGYILVMYTLRTRVGVREC
jgi:hypothetical protein